MAPKLQLWEGWLRSVDPTCCRERTATQGTGPNSGQIGDKRGRVTEDSTEASAVTGEARARELDDLTCDPVAGTLATAEEAVRIGPRGARLMELLLRRRGMVVAQADLIAAGWPGYAVEESSLNVEIASLRGALRRLLGGHNWITTTARKGVRLVPNAAAAHIRVPGQWESPSIGVLSLTATDPALSPFATGLTATLTSTLAQHAALSIAPGFVAGMAAQQRAEGAQTLGLRYLLDGVLQGDGPALRITLTLSETVESRVIWTQSFDEPALPGLARQDMIAAEVVQALDRLLVRGEEAAIAYPPTRNLTAWGHYIRGLGHAYWPRHDMLWGSEVLLALDEWHRALALDPESADLLATVGAGYAVLAAYPAVVDPAEAAAQAVTHLHAALERAPDHPIALAYHAMMLSEADRFEVAAEVARRAIRLAPHAPAVTAVASVALCAAGCADEAVAAVERTLAATPHFPAIFSPPLARAWRTAGRLDEAIRFLEALHDEPHKFDGRELILAYMQAGRQEDAVNAATRLLLLEPRFTVSGWLATQHRSDRAAIARDAAALRAVGLPE